MRERNLRRQVHGADGVVVGRPRDYPVTPGERIGKAAVLGHRLNDGRKDRVAARPRARSIVAKDRFVLHVPDIGETGLGQEQGLIGAEHGTQYLRDGDLRLQHVLAAKAGDLFPGSERTGLALAEQPSRPS